MQVVDVREPDEFDGPLGHIPNAMLMPLGTLEQRFGELRKDEPVIVVCRAGGRSARAAVKLRQAGFSKVANLAGGMLSWRVGGHSLQGGTD